MTKGAIFDLDGVLLDSMGIWNDLGARYLRSRGLMPEPGLNEILFSMSMEQGAEYLHTHYPLAQSAGHVTHALQRLGLLGYFAQIFTTGEIGVSKHEPTIYLLAAQALGSAPGETIVFEDSLYALKTAKAAGFYTVGVYDADGESDQAGLKAAADLYVKELGEAAARW